MERGVGNVPTLRGSEPDRTSSIRQEAQARNQIKIKQLVAKVQ
jgi:hypothetical protein